MKSMCLSVLSERAETIAAEIIIAPWFLDDRPLRGGAGRIDWRMCEFFSTLIDQGLVTGEPGNLFLLRTDGSVRSPVAVLAGMGRKSESTLQGLEEMLARAFFSSLELGNRRIALCLETIKEVQSEFSVLNFMSKFAPIVTSVGLESVRCNFLVDSKDHGAVQQEISRLVLDKPDDFSSQVLATAKNSRNGPKGSTDRSRGRYF